MSIASRAAASARDRASSFLSHDRGRIIQLGESHIARLNDLAQYANPHVAKIGVVPPLERVHRTVCRFERSDNGAMTTMGIEILDRG